MRYPAGNVVDAGAEGGVGGGHVAAMKQEREREKERRKSEPAAGVVKPKMGKRWLCVCDFFWRWGLRLGFGTVGQANGLS